MDQRRTTSSSIYQFIRSILGANRKDRQPAGEDNHLRSSFARGITAPTMEGRDSERSFDTSKMVSNGNMSFNGTKSVGKGKHPPVPSVFDFRALSSDRSGHLGAGDTTNLDRDMQDALPTPPVSKPPAPVPRTTAPRNIRDTQYFMNHRNRGVAVIINNRTFDRSLSMPERKGTDLDAEVLQKAFALMGFAVFRWDDLSVHNMRECMKYHAALDHTDSDCFLAAFLSHGDDGIVFGTDGKLTVENLISPFKGNKCVTLAGKPKMFVFQACRGDRLDRGVDMLMENIVADDKDNVLRLPAEADFLFAYSTIPGFYSWRNTDNGSWYIQALAKLIQLYYGSDSREDIEFVRLLTKVNFEVAYYYKSSVPTNFDLDQQKQIPSIVSQLTRDLYFPVKAPLAQRMDDQVVAESRPETL